MRSAWRIVMTSFMEHRDDKIVEHYDGKLMVHCDDIGHGALS